jgi:hypothetical protein
MVSWWLLVKKNFFLHSFFAFAFSTVCTTPFGFLVRDELSPLTRRQARYVSRLQEFCAYCYCLCLLSGICNRCRVALLRGCATSHDCVAYVSLTSLIRICTTQHCHVRVCIASGCTWHLLLLTAVIVAHTLLVVSFMFIGTTRCFSSTTSRRSNPFWMLLTEWSSSISPLIGKQCHLSFWVLWAPFPLLPADRKMQKSYDAGDIMRERDQEVCSQFFFQGHKTKDL